jgi:DNA-binding IclR family transcriptional regulator
VTNQSLVESNSDLVATKTVSQPRSGSKLARVIALLSKDAGASLKTLAEATGWLPHTTRAALTGLRKRGFEIGRVKDDRLGAVYRLASEAKVTTAA